MSQPPGFVERHSAAELRHYRPSSFNDNPDDIRVGSVVLPADVGEVRDARDIPHAAAIDAVAANAVTIEQVHCHSLFLLRTAQPVPGAAI
jgi:hypothetical protein